MAHAWYVVQSKPNAEREALRRLRNQSFECYLPMLTVRRYVRGRMCERLEPLFRGYLFVKMAIDDIEDHAWKAVGSTQGVLTVLPTCEHPEAVRDSEVDALIDAELHGYFRLGAVLPGERLKMFRGSLVNQVLECIKVQGERISCLWSCFGAQRVVHVHLADVTVLR